MGGICHRWRVLVSHRNVVWRIRTLSARLNHRFDVLCTLLVVERRASSLRFVPGEANNILAANP